MKSIVALTLNLLIAFLLDYSFASAFPKTFQTLLSLPYGSTNQVKKIAGLGGSEWSGYSCCRRALGIQTRERMITSQIVNIEIRECAWDYCLSCVDDLDFCAQLRELQDACDPDSNFFGFMTARCPKTCFWCDPTTIIETTTTDNSASKSQLQRINIFFFEETPLIIYNFNMLPEDPPSPWIPNAESPYDGEVDSFHLYKKKPEVFGQGTTELSMTKVDLLSLQSKINFLSKFFGFIYCEEEGCSKNNRVNAHATNLISPTDEFTMPIAFCSYYFNEKKIWIVSNSECNSDWTQEMVLYASRVPLPNSERLFVANRDLFLLSSRIFRDVPCCGYIFSAWNFYAPSVEDDDLSGVTTPISFPEPSTTASVTTTTESSVISTNSDPIEKECLKYHDHFRAVHNVPSFTLNPDLTVTAKRWAEYLANNAPNHPFGTMPGFNRTVNWPHSERGSYFRGNGVGENIAWDFSPEGSSPKESILRWYAEIFDYDHNNPLLTRPNKPTGHFTQMIWKDSMQLGCAVAVAKVQRGSFEYSSTYTVAHYAPSGNVHYPTTKLTIKNYQKNVPLPKAGTCMSPATCSVYKGEKSQCMGMSENMSCSCTSNKAGVIGGRPRCYGSGGCIVVCKNPNQNNGVHRWVNECQGRVSCECILFPKNGKLGASCA